MGFLHSMKKKANTTTHKMKKAGTAAHIFAKKTQHAVIGAAKMADSLAGKGLDVADRVLDVADALAPAISLVPGGAAVNSVVHGLDEIVSSSHDAHQAVGDTAREVHSDYKKVKGAFNSNPKDIVERSHELNKAAMGVANHGGPRSRIERHRKK